MKKTKQNKSVIGSKITELNNPYIFGNSSPSKEINRLISERTYWKKTYGDLNQDIKDQEVLEKPYFNIEYWTSKNPNYIFGISTETSKEMMEWFLKSYGNKKQNEIISINTLKKNIRFGWAKLLEIKKQNSKKRNLIPFEWFNDLEYLITDDEMFYTFAKDVWIYGSHLLTNKEKMFSRYGRSNTTLEKRIERSDYFSKDKYISTTKDNPTIVNSITHNGLDSEIYLNELSKYDEEDYISIYRSFTVRDGKPIRLSNQKYIDDRKSIINPNYFKQVEGEGWSFSLDKFVAARFAWNINTYHYKKYCNINDKNALDLMVSKWFLDEEQRNDPKHTEGHYGCMGRYEVRKKDIILICDHRSEREIIVNPNNVRLRDYYFLNLVDHIAMKFTITLTSPGVTHGKIVRNFDDIYCSIRPVLAKYFKDNPDELVYILKNGYQSKINTIFNIFLNEYDISQVAINTSNMENNYNFLFFLNKDKEIFRLKDIRKNSFRNCSNSIKATSVLS